MTPDQQLKERRRYHAKAVRNRLAGLTAHGTQPTRQTLTPDQRAERNREKYHRIARERMLRGLTSRGTVRIYRPRVSARELAWREFRASMGIHRPEILHTLDREAA
jgi:hypothetical protein